MPSLAAPLLCLAAIAAAEPTTPQAAIAGLAVEGASAIAPAQIREALAGDIRIRRLARRGTDATALAAAAAPLTELGYRASGFAEARVTAAGAALGVSEGPYRTWSALAITAPTLQAQALAGRLLSEATSRGSGLPIPAGEQVPDAERQEPLWRQGAAARFDPGFVQAVRQRLERGWAASGRARPAVAVTVEASAADAARCLVRLDEPPPPAITGILVAGAVANPPESVADWLAGQAGVQAGSPADQALLDAACARLVETGRFLGATARVEPGGGVVVTVREHPLLPLLTAELSDWQRRWLDTGEQMRALYQTGPGVSLHGSLPRLQLAGGLRLSRSRGQSLRLGPDGDAARTWELLVDGDRVGLFRSDGAPLSCRLASGGPFGLLGIGPPDGPEQTMTLTMQLGFSTRRSGSMGWSCVPAALLATAGRTWTTDPAQPGEWRQADEQGRERFRVRWDERGRWLSWDFVGEDGCMRLSPADPPPAIAGAVIAGTDLWREVLREPDRWLRSRSGQPWADRLVGVAAGICVPAASLWPAAAPGGPPRPEFAIPAPTDAEAQPQLAQIGMALGLVADAVGSAIGPRAWPTLLCACAAAGLEGDMPGLAAMLQDLHRPECMGPLGRLAEAWLLRRAGIPIAADVARLGLQACSAERAWADIAACAGSEELLLRWVMAIERVEDAARLAPPGQRAGIVADLQALRAAPATGRRALLAAAFTRWWDAGLGDLVKAELERLAGG